MITRLPPSNRTIEFSDVVAVLKDCGLKTSRYDPDNQATVSVHLVSDLDKKTKALGGFEHKTS